MAAISAAYRARGPELTEQGREELHVTLDEPVLSSNGRRAFLGMAGGIDLPGIMSVERRRVILALCVWLEGTAFVILLAFLAAANVSPADAVIDSLCAAVTRWAKNGGIATSLCVQLRRGQLGAFRNEVAAQAGKSFTNEPVAALIRLSQSL